MSLVSGVLVVRGCEQGRVGVVAEGRSLSDCVVAAKAQLMALLNAEMAAAGAAGAVLAEAGACVQ